MNTRNSQRLKLCALFVVIAAITTACQSETTETTLDSGPSTTGGDSVTPTTEPPLTGTFRVGLVSNITTDNWWAALDTEDSSHNQGYLSNMKASLYKLTVPGFVYVPDLAATEDPVGAVRQGDGWLVDQPIRGDGTWSDGVSVTANDLAFYFDAVREFKLGGTHARRFPPNVASITAIDEFTVQIRFSSRPALADWQSGVGLASFVPSHFWAPHVEEARAASQALAASLTPEDAIQAMIDASLEDENPETLTREQITQTMIDAHIANSAAAAGRAVLYGVSGPKEPSAGPQIFEEWEPGVRAVTISNTDYFDRGTENTLYSDGSFRIRSDKRGDSVYGGDGSGDVVAQYVEGPFVAEILWIEHESKEAAYQALAAGEVDYVWDADGVSSGLRSELAANPDLSFAVNPTESFRYLAFNLRKPPLSDMAFRRALATLIDKELVADTILAGAVSPVYTVVHPEHDHHHNDQVERPGWSDGAPMSEADRFLTAVQILKDAGYTWDFEPIIDPSSDDPVTTAGEGLTMPNGVKVPPLTLMAPGAIYDPYRATFSIWIETWARDLGIPITATPTDFDAIVAAVFPPQTTDSAVRWDMYILGWGAGDPSLPGRSLVAFFHSREDAINGGSNTPGYSSAEFDATADAFEAAPDRATAAQLTREMDAIVARDLPYVVLFRTPIVEVFRSHVKFPTTNILGGLSGLPSAWPNAVQISD